MAMTARSPFRQNVAQGTRRIRYAGAAASIWLLIALASLTATSPAASDTVPGFPPIPEQLPAALFDNPLVIPRDIIAVGRRVLGDRLWVSELSDESADPGYAQVRPLGSDYANFGYGPERYRFYLPVVAQAGSSLILEIDGLYREFVVRVFTADQQPLGDPIVVFEAGLAVEEDQVMRQNRTLLFLLPFADGGRYVVTLDMDTESSRQMAAVAYTHAGFYQTIRRRSLGFGAFYGFMFALLLYNLFLFAALRDTRYLWYVIYLIALIATELSIDRLPLLSVHPSQYRMYLAGRALLFPGLMAGVLAVSRAILGSGTVAGTRSVSAGVIGRVLHRAIWSLPVVAAAVAVLAPYRTAMMANMVALVIVLVGVLAAAVRRAVAGDREAMIYLAGWAGLLIVGAASTLNVLGVINAPYRSLWFSLNKAAAMQEALFFSLALAAHIRRIEDDRLRAEHRAELERRQIADDLHDSIGNELTTLIATVHTGGSLAPVSLRRSLEGILADLREIVSHRGNHADLNLEEELEQMTARVNRSRAMAMEMQVEGALADLPGKSARAAGAVVREWTTNLIKHSGADRATIRVCRRRERLLIGIRDNGGGFSWRTGATHAAAATGSGTGLGSMQRHIVSAGGRARSCALPGEGSLFVLSVPAPDPLQEEQK